MEELEEGPLTAHMGEGGGNEEEIPQASQPQVKSGEKHGPSLPLPAVQGQDGPGSDTSSLPPASALDGNKSQSQAPPLHELYGAFYGASGDPNGVSD